MQTPQQDYKLSYNFLGKTGVKVSDLCLGCMTFGDRPAWGGFPGIPEDRSIELINRYVEVGGNFFDTANIYTAGHSEEILGSWIQAKGKRNDYIVATKCGIANGPGINDVGGSRRNIIASLEASLQRLKTDYVDLYQMHTFDWATDQMETLRTFDDLVRCGKVRYLGCSNFLGYQLQRALSISEFCGLEKYVTLQPQYSLLSRGIELELTSVCRENNIGVLPWSPLKGGWLAGRYQRGQEVPKEGRIAWAEKVGWSQTNFTKWNGDATFDLLDKVKSVADSIGATMAEVSLRWVMQKDFVTSTIIGASSLKQLNENLSASRIRLSPEQMQFLDEASSLPQTYPYDSFEELKQNRLKGKRPF
jgi:aryl-alcohol dehydrogenase-like predicted oxidoreductase